MAFDPRTLLQGAPYAAPVGPTVPEDVKAFVTRLGSGAPASTLPSASEIEGDQIDTALADDARRQGAATLAANVDRYAQMFRGENTGPLQVPALDDNLRAYVMKKRAEQEGEDREMKRGSAALDVLRIQMAAEQEARRRKAEAEKRQADEEHRNRQQAETERHNRAAESRPPSYPIVIGPEGQQFRINPRDPNAPAIPVVDTEGKPVVKPQGGAHGSGMADVVERKRVMLSDGQLKTIAEYDRFRDALRDISSRKSEIDTGPVASRRNAVASKVGADDPEVSAFRASVGDALASYIRGLSGAAVSDRERAFLLQNVPKMEDEDGVFDAKLKAVLSRLDRLRAMEIDLFRRQGKDVSGFTGEAPPSDVGGAEHFAAHAAAAGGPVQVRTKAERDALPSGTQYVGPDGKTYTKR